ncbi:ATP-binding protein [Nocardioides sp. C4-1]|uniref:sensor histidine kinase n=1 Tax=Nocardioides sp. C4-1 TaxID=3151851 RepID=UPI00326722C2
MRERRRLTLAGQFLLLQLVVVALLLLVVGVIGVRQSDASFQNERGPAMRSAAEDTASLPLVQETLSDLADLPPRVVSERLAPLLVRALGTGADDVYVVDTAGVVVAASDPTLVGTRAELGSSDALEGRGWVGDVVHDGRRTAAGHAPVYPADGSGPAGIVVAEQDYPTLRDRLTGSASDLALYLGVGAVLGLVGSFAVSRVVKRGTRGLDSDQIANLADQREALLHSIREGVVAVGTDGRVTMVNDAARRTLGLPDDADPVGRRVDDLGLDPHVVTLLTEGETQDAVALVGTRVVVFNRRSASSHGRGIGSVTTLRDRTELVSLQSQLSSNLSITDTLRAQTHEFDNRLHTISGLVQLGEYDEVRTLVGDLARHRSEVGAFVSARIADPAVAALVVAKDSVAAERGVELVLDAGSRLSALPADVSADLTTVLGNLVDNAVDAAASLVEVWLTEVDGDVHLRVRDDGPGVPVDLREAIFVRGFSTKPEVLGGRGIGLPLVQLICTQRGGSVEVGRAAEEGGAEFVVVLPRSMREGVPS